MSICLKINTHIKLLGLVVQVFHSCFDTVHRYLQPKGGQRMTTRLQTVLSRLELSTNLEGLLETNPCFMATEATELKCSTISADPIKKYFIYLCK